MSNPEEFLSRTGFRRVTATTSPNLTGPITSVGNATSIASNVALPGSPTTTTQTTGDNTTKIATTAFVNASITQALSTGISATIVTAALTGGGTQGSMTFTNGLLTAQTPAT
jgi:hypothetical protein